MARGKPDQGRNIRKRMLNYLEVYLWRVRHEYLFVDYHVVYRIIYIIFHLSHKE